MENLKKMDLLHFKYMVIGTNILNKDDVKNIDHYKKILDLITKKCGADSSAKIGNDILRNLRCNSLMQNNINCTNINETDMESSGVSNETLLLFQLFEILNEEEFFYVLKEYFNTDRKKYLNLELDIKSIDWSNSVEKTSKWLRDNNIEFYDIQNFLKNNSSKIDGGIPKPSVKADGDISKSNRKGICFVIINVNVKGYQGRPGAEADSKNIEETFKAEGFYVQVENDVTEKNMGTYIGSIKDQIEERDELIAVFVMSYGDDESIITSDGFPYHLDDLYKLFNNENCPKLIHKPKLFFIVSCSGKREPKIDTDSAESDRARDEHVPKVSDFFFGYSAYLANRTSYVESLCKAIKCRKSSSIHDIHNEVNEDDNNIVKADTDFASFQTPYYLSMLDTLKHRVFRPKF